MNPTLLRNDQVIRDLGELSEFIRRDSLEAIRPLRSDLRGSAHGDHR